MSVLLETTLGEIVIDLYIDKAPLACTNFLKLCKLKYYNFAQFHLIQKNFIAQVGQKSDSIWGLLEGESKRFFAPEIYPKLKHKRKGIVSFATQSSKLKNVPVAGSQFFITLTDNNLDYLDSKHAIFGLVVEGHDVLDKLNETLCDIEGHPYRDLRIKHTIILDDPFPDIEGMKIPSRSPSPEEDVLAASMTGEEEGTPPQLSEEELEKERRRRDADARKLVLEMVGDLPFAEIKPPENVLFVCKLNSITTEEDLEIIFSQFGKILSCEIVRDRRTGDSLCYAFIEFESKSSCEEAYCKMDNVLIDRSRIHVDFSQSVSKLHINFLQRSRHQKNSPNKYKHVKATSSKSPINHSTHSYSPHEREDNLNNTKGHVNPKESQIRYDTHEDTKYDPRSSSRSKRHRDRSPSLHRSHHSHSHNSSSNREHRKRSRHRG